MKHIKGSQQIKLCRNVCTCVQPAVLVKPPAIDLAGKYIPLLEQASRFTMTGSQQQKPRVPINLQKPMQSFVKEQTATDLFFFLLSFEWSSD